MDIDWFGHSCFRLREQGVTIVTDLYDRTIGYSMPRVRADIVTISHDSPGHMGGPLDDPVMCVASNILGSLLFEVSSNRLDGMLLSPGGITNDTFTLIKTNFPPVAQEQVRRTDREPLIKLGLGRGELIVVPQDGHVHRRRPRWEAPHLGKAACPFLEGLLRH